MKYPTLIILLMLLSSCGQSSTTDSVVSISGYQGTREVIRGMGVCIGADMVLTSAHVVRDDTINYQVSSINYESIGTSATLSERDHNSDIAYMKVKNEEGRMKGICKNYKEYLGKSDSIAGESISVPVIRSGSLVTLTGAITSLTGTILAYDSVGRTQMLS